MSEPKETGLKLHKRLTILGPDLRMGHIIGNIRVMRLPQRKLPDSPEGQ